MRKSIRLKDYDYTSIGSYFITICSKNRKRIFGEIKEGEVVYSTLGKIACVVLNGLEKRFPSIQIDCFVIMPNHIHMVIHIVEKTEVNIGSIVGAYKSLVSRAYRGVLINQGNVKHTGIWQKNYYERVIRNDLEGEIVRDYIENNVAKWDLDQYYCC